ncbi:hypothetical protein OHA53_11035 [Streptomyces althioticus]|uniref:hypothetical protein n=1 Tax=Streptomyces althioticus TaxID=83380 RepID=UPI003872D43F|nr:hypothetical protein OHA53_11035 [Streptomyces althioticus]
MEETTCGAIDPNTTPDQWQHSPCQRLAGHPGYHLSETCHRWEPQAELISLGTDASGREVLVQSGGAIHGAATLEAAAALHGLVSAVIDGEAASEAELAAFVTPLVECLGDVLGLFGSDSRAGAIQAMHQALSSDVRQPIYGTSARALGQALRDSSKGGAL